nr:MAG TPA: hypothetical protein [Caudoviricetes sp.]
MLCGDRYFGTFWNIYDLLRVLTSFFSDCKRYKNPLSSYQYL